MSFFFPDLQDPDAIPLPPAEVRLTRLEAEPYPDGTRLRVNLETTPFQQRPWLEVSLLDADGQEVANASIIEPMTWKLEFTLHIRRQPPQGRYVLQARLFYPQQPDNDQRSLQVSV